ncbi:hypothetical protein KY330_02345 [Candidatus Woesearchaeota archaeon]|nr:hypothetical protein [Candidatus Woesearchaeota archaeon]
MQSIKVKCFDLKLTLDSGHFFRYKPYKNGFLITTKEYMFYCEQRKDELFFDEIPREELIKFFNLNHDLNEVYIRFQKDLLLSRLITQYHGLRIMNIDPWESMIGFVCSAASSIQKIKKNMNQLALKFGEKRKNKFGGYYVFPRPGAINDLDKIKACSCGFRSKYIFELSKSVTETELNKIKNLSFSEAEKKLSSFPGIGKKVADCIMIYSYNFTEAFPVDVWLAKILNKYYFPNEKNKEKLSILAQKKFKNDSNYVQQYLFHHARITKMKE